jgi:type IV secretory pathway VirB2 component (pilin)
VVAGTAAVVVAPVALAAAVVVVVAFGVVMIFGEKRNQPESWAFQFHCWGDWY